MEFECRTCLKVSANVRNIFSNDLLFKIKSISSVEISEDDRLPSTICEECVGKLTQMYEFCQVIRTSNVILMSRCIKEEAVTTTETYHNKDEEVNLEVKQERIFEDFAVETAELGSENNEIFRCILCDFSSSEYGLWKCHQEEHKKPRPNKDEEINLEFKQERIFEDFTVETLELGSENNEIFMCILCDFSSSKYGLWKCHQKKHKKARRQLKKLSLTHTDFPVNCLICDRVFKNEKSLRTHLSMHENGLYPCTICGKVYRYSVGYYHHAKLHAIGDAKTLECATCGKLFLKKQTLVRHIYSHTGERPFPCRYCDRGFGSSNQRNTHESFDCIHFYSEEPQLNTTLLV